MKVQIMRNYQLLLFFFFLISLDSQAQEVPNRSTLTIEQIMQGEQFVGYSPERISWSDDSKTIYFEWNPEGELISGLYKSNTDGAQPEKVSIEEERTLARNGDYSKNQQKKLYSKNGDLYLWDKINNTTLQLTNTIEDESGASFAMNDRSICYRKGNDLFVLDLDNSTTRQITHFVNGVEQSPGHTKSHRAWLEDDQMAHFEVLQKRKSEREAREDIRSNLSPKRPSKYYLEGWSLRNLKASPDLKAVFFQLSQRFNNNGTNVPNFVTESGYIEMLPSRPKVGSPQTEYQQWIYLVEKDSFYQIDLSVLPGIYDKPAYLLDYVDDPLSFETEYDSPRNAIAHGPYFSSGGQMLLEFKAIDNKDRWICLLDPMTGALKNIDTQHDDAWIGGPGIVGWNGVPGNLGWLPDNETVYFQSEETGFSHLYLANIQTGEKRALTNGKFEILSAQLSNAGDRFFIRANKEGPHDQHFYHLDIESGKMKRLTPKSGNYEVEISPDENWLAIRYSYSNQPWELFVMPNKGKAKMQQITQSTTASWQGYNWRVPEIVYFEAEDGAQVPARIYRPENAAPNGPAVIFVHGAGYLQNVHNWWSSYYREYMFHNMLVDNGYTVLDIDYRASRGYGRNWRTAIYRHMGGKDLSDQVDGAKFLVEQYNIDPNRIGIYGGSYGGFITMMALFKHPGTFKCGAALRSVTDWAHYNHPYTSNILNTPESDSIAFYRSSPIYHAEGLEDHLLILHGMIDQNVQFQDVVRLSQRLIELGKDNWEFAVFPLERHGFIEPSSWTDEYKRIFKLFQTHLN